VPSSHVCTVDQEASVLQDLNTTWVFTSSILLAARALAKGIRHLLTLLGIL
jgi:hypothetical protein